MEGQLLETSWWWTIGRGGDCDQCGARVAGTVIAYESLERTVLCETCADETGVADSCRESKRARRARQQRLATDWF